MSGYIQYSNPSYGEKECRKCLQSMKINYDAEIAIPELPNKRFDVRFEYNQKVYLLEFDGRQHFEETGLFNRNVDDEQANDILKTREAIKAGYFVIRIDYKCEPYIKQHIQAALNAPYHHFYYFSTPKMYKYLSDAIYNGY